jgi:hypothetical protein
MDNAPPEVRLEPMPPHRVIRFRGNGLCRIPVALILCAGCEPAPDTAPEATSNCAPGGFLETALHGAIRADVRWQDDALTCEGMPRPEGRGARLRFSGPLNDAEDGAIVAIILGIPDLARDETESELPTNVTLIEEGAGRFFGTQDTSGCWTDIHEQFPVGAAPDVHRVAGTVYCVSPLAELNGGSSISFTDLSFSGRLDWTVPE